MTDGSLNWLWPTVGRASVPVALAAALFLPSVSQVAERHRWLLTPIVDHIAPPGAAAGLPTASNLSCWRSPGNSDVSVTLPGPRLSQE
jgi:hypothetical protein